MRAFAPGRVTVVGEHVDYAGGVVVCMAVHLGVTVDAQPCSAPRQLPSPLPGATLQALRERGLDVPQLDLDIAATLPYAAGLSSSAALCGATAVAALRLLGARLDAADLAELMLHAERDIAGVPCGPLDQRAVVHAPRDGALVLDCRDGGREAVPWLPGYVLAACHTGDTHDVGGEGYRTRRGQAAAALHALGAASYRDLDLATLDHRAARLDPVLLRRARHIVSETGRALDCAAALRDGDAARVGRLMHDSHASLRDDYAVSTPALDAVVEAAEASDGCLGARLCGAGFGGTAVALVAESHADACLAAMRAALPGGGDAGEHTRGAWVLRPSPGLALLAPDVVA